MKISISIVRYKHSKKDILNYIKQLDFNVISILYIIDNSEDDFFIDNQNIIFVKTGHNLGYGRAHNIAMDLSFSKNTDIHINSNIDLFFSEGFWLNYCKSLVENPRFVPRILNEDSSVQEIHVKRPTLVKTIKRLFFKSNNSSGDYFVKNKQANIKCFSGCFLPVERNFYIKKGGFNNIFWMYYEDLELSERISDFSGNWLVRPGLEIIHIHEQATFKNIKLFRAHLISGIKYYTISYFNLINKYI